MKYQLVFLLSTLSGVLARGPNDLEYGFLHDYEETLTSLENPGSVPEDRRLELRKGLGDMYHQSHDVKLWLEGPLVPGAPIEGGNDAEKQEWMKYFSDLVAADNRLIAIVVAGNGPNKRKLRRRMINEPKSNIQFKPQTKPQSRPPRPPPMKVNTLKNSPPKQVNKPPGEMLKSVIRQPPNKPNQNEVLKSVIREPSNKMRQSSVSGGNQPPKSSTGQSLDSKMQQVWEHRNGPTVKVSPPKPKQENNRSPFQGMGKETKSEFNSPTSLKSPGTPKKEAPHKDLFQGFAENPKPDLSHIKSPKSPGKPKQEEQKAFFQRIKETTSEVGSPTSPKSPGTPKIDPKNSIKLDSDGLPIINSPKFDPNSRASFDPRKGTFFDEQRGAWIDPGSGRLMKDQPIFKNGKWIDGNTGKSISASSLRQSSSSSKSSESSGIIDGSEVSFGMDKPVFWDAKRGKWIDGATRRVVKEQPPASNIHEDLPDSLVPDSLMTFGRKSLPNLNQQNSRAQSSTKSEGGNPNQADFESLGLDPNNLKGRIWRA